MSFCGPSPGNSYKIKKEEGVREEGVVMDGVLNILAPFLLYKEVTTNFDVR